MNQQQFLALSPMIVLSSIILVQMMVIAFARNLKTTVVISTVALVATFLMLFPVHDIVPIVVTPLIRIDGYAVFFSGLILMAALAVTLMSWDYLKDRGQRKDEYFMLLLLSTLGALILVSSTHFASFILGLELLGVSLYTMMSYPSRGFFTLEAALKYLILSGVSSAFILFGAALLYAVSGELSFSRLFSLVAASTGSASLFVLAGSTLIFAGVMFKLSLAPFHMWTPDVYEGAPAPVTAFLATVSKGAVFALALRLFASSDLISSQALLTGLSFVAVLSMLAGNLLALRQDNIKRILAYSSIAHLGYLLVIFIAAGIVGGSLLAVEASSYFLFAYFLTTLGAFSVVTTLSIPHHDADIGDIALYEGLFWRRPALATMFTAMLLSLAGIPLTAGFIGKVYILSAGVEGSLWLLLAVVIIGSGIGIYYYLRIIFTMTRKSGDQGTIPIPVTAGWVMLLLFSALIVFGVYPTPVIALINHLIVA